MSRFALLACFALGCVTTVDDDLPTGGGKADDSTTCEDEPRYGDGTCHVDLACGIADIDCFEIYANDKEAFSAAAARGLAILPWTDTRYAGARALLDESWEMFKEHTPMGALADKHLSLVLVDEDSINAFVYPTIVAGVAHFAVFVHIGLLDAGLTPNELHGIMFHELAHLEGLHVSDEVWERTQRFYVAPNGMEPIGATQADNATVRQAFAEWRRLVDLAGVYTSPDLVDLPFGGRTHDLMHAYLNRLALPPQCNDAVSQVRNATADLQPRRFDQALAITSDQKSASLARIAALKACMVSVGYTETFAELRSPLAAYIGPLVVDQRYDALPALDGILAVQRDWRAKVAAAQTAFETKTGRPWSALRYFSTEEQADDHSARLTKLTGLDVVGVSGFLETVMARKPDQKALCDAALASGGPIPYGEYLVDDHHGTCWRMGHARQIDASTRQRSREIRVRAAEPWVPTLVTNRLVY